MEMSDGLIERLEKQLRGESDLVILKNELVAILSALKTVRGIEGLLSKGSGEVFIDTLSVPGKTVVSWDNKDGCLVVESTLSLAVDAAVGASNKGESNHG